MSGAGSSTHSPDTASGAFDIIVLGAGISGLVSASALLREEGRRVLVVDEYDRVGGNHLDYAFGPYTFDIGSLVFQDDSPLLRHFPELLPRYTPIEPSWGKLNPQGRVARYPFSMRDDFFAAGVVEASKMVLSLAFARLFQRRMENAKDFARFWIGDRLLRRSGLAHYMARFYGLDPALIDLEFARKRMFWIAEHASMVKLVGRWLTATVAKPVEHRTNQQLARPREGFTYLYQPAVERLAKDGAVFVLGEKLGSITRTGSTFELSVGGRSFSAGRVISTIPVARTRELCGLPTGDPLPTVTLISLFFSFTGNRGFTDCILYNFSHDGSWKRLTMYSDFYGEAAGREYFTVEVVADREHRTVESAEHGFREHVSRNGLLEGELQLEGSHILSQAYPLYTGRSEEKARSEIAELRDFGIDSFGRHGGFQYQPTARVSTLEAEAAVRAATQRWRP